MPTDPVLPPAARPGTCGLHQVPIADVRPVGGGVGRSLVRTAARLLGVLVVVGAPACGLAAGPVRADAVGSTQQQISQVQAAIAASAGRVHDLTAAYARAQVTDAALGQQLTADRAALATARARVAAERAAMADAALAAYTGAATGGATGAGAGGRSTTPDIADVYLQVASGTAGEVADDAATTARQLAVAEATVAADQAAAARADAAVSSARRAALADAATAEGQLLALQTRLGDLQAQAAAAAARAAAASRTVVATPPHALGGPVQGGLVAAVGQAVAPPAPTPQAGGPTASQWQELRQCESGDNYRANTGNGYYGAYQFDEQTWTGLGYPGRPDLEPPAMQDQAAARLQARSGWGQWPACSAALGL